MHSGRIRPSMRARVEHSPNDLVWQVAGWQRPSEFAMCVCSAPASKDWVHRSVD